MYFTFDTCGELTRTHTNLSYGHKKTAESLRIF